MSRSGFSRLKEEETCDGVLDHGGMRKKHGDGVGEERRSKVGADLGFQG